MNQPTTALDWAQVRAQYPKAFATMSQWAKTLPLSAQAETYVEGNGKFSLPTIPANPRDLYDWLDGQGVFVSPAPVPCRDDIAFYVYVTVGKRNQYQFGPFDTRHAAETAGFAAAFGVLEKQLTSQNEQRG